MSVAAAGHSLAVDRAGGLWTWGRNDSGGGGRGGSAPLQASGQLGRPRDGHANLPCQVMLPICHVQNCACLDVLLKGRI